MTETREVLGVLTVWVQCGLPFAAGVLALKIGRDYWQHLKEEHRKLQLPETRYLANAVWKPREKKGV